MNRSRYVTGQSNDPGGEFVFVQYKGHTLQGSYDGGFVYARKPFLPSSALVKVAKVARVSSYILYCCARSVLVHYRELSESLFG